ncbi:MAG: 50S ribosomal protein L18 [Bacteroidales bacterium]|nr:50S ribosomal protein L18 [Bacteroidales bacterium]
MAIKNKKEYSRKRVKMRIRKVINGSAERPRMTVFRSSKEIYVQLIDDASGKTIVAASSRAKDIAEQKLTKIEKAKLVGKFIANQAKEAGIETVVFDRNGYKYHGRIKSLAEAAREGGLKF